MIKALSFLLLIISKNIFSQSSVINSIPIECISNPMFGHYYRQQTYQINSHQDDMILASLGSSYKDIIKNILNLKEIDHDKRKDQSQFIKENCAPFIIRINEGEKLLEEQSRFMDDSTVCQLNQIRDSQRELLKLNCDKNNIIRKSPIKIKEYMSKVLATLAMGATAMFMMTEHDSQLREWLVQRPLASVGPEQLFQKSLELQKGDIYKALLSIENVLSEFWRTRERQLLRQTGSLRSITNYCPSETPEDIYGTWYHLFGTMLLGCVQGGGIATIVGRTESLGGRVLDLKEAKKNGDNLLLHLLIGTDPQEEKINARGGLIGNRICRNIPRNYQNILQSDEN